ncbi:MAG: sacsin N-terminal ATP-binding-like domain-containing protein, partial [Flavobacterium sp.]
MLYTRNAFHFRKYFKEQRSANYIDLNFIGALHKPINKPPVEGFASLTVGNREDVGKYLSTVALNVAADDQAIYELIQNADDSKSSFFSVSYNEKYLLCINNGNYFSDNDMSAIINVAGNFKEGEDIGTFGIGFKILHRLVGKDDGRDAIINDYYGPIIFSWNKPSQFEKFINGDPIIITGLGAKGKENYDYEKDKENAWLVKILYTCFPSNYKEPVRIGDYETRESKFDEAELLEMRTFLEKVLEDTNIKGEGRRKLQNGSIFFLKLGPGKKKFLDDGIDKIKSGLSYSFKFLNSLEKIYINGEEILEQKVDFYSKSYPVLSDEFSQVNPKNKKRDIKFTFAFYKDYRKAENLREGIVPNLYTFFSMDEEKNGFNFLLHCNAFDMSNNRRHLQSNSQINEKLLPLIANDINLYLEKQKDKNRDLFLSLYANLLLSNEPVSKPHLKNYFFKFLKDYLHQNIPTQSGFSSNSENVKIKTTYLPIKPSDFDCPEIEWFVWFNEKTDKALIDEARSSEKLKLQKWDIVDLLKYAISKGKIEPINNWIKTANQKHFEDLSKKDYTYLSLIQEIDKNTLEKDIPIISQIKLFRFSDGNFYSIVEIISNPNLILIYEKVLPIKRELRTLGFIVSDLNLSFRKEGADTTLYSNLEKLIVPKIDEESLYKVIAEKCKVNILRPEQKHNVFFTLKDFNRVGPETLKDLELFKDAFGNIRPLRNLLKEGDTRIPNWLNNFKINPYEYINKLDEYLVKDKDVYQSIIYKNWDFIIGQKLNIAEFYTQVTDYYKQNPENQKLDKLSSIFTNDGFKKVEQVFFNTNLNSHYFYELQNAILKISDKAMPSKLIFDFLIDDNSPFKVSRNDTFSSLITSYYNLTYSETVAVLSFAKTNNERLFSIASIENQADDFLLAKHNHSIFQYYSSRKEINELLFDQPNFKLFPQKFNPSDFKELGILQDKELYMQIIQTLEFSENLLPVVRECDKEVQLSYLNKVKNLALEEGKIYDKGSFEHRCIKLAIDCYDNTFQTQFAPKIIINNSIRIKDIAVKDDINFDNFTLSLATVLPEYKGVSDIITKIINQFTDITKTELSEKVFPISNKKKEDIFTELIAKFPTLQYIEQFAFLLYYSKQIGKNLFTNQSLTGLVNIEILQFAYEQKFTELNAFVDLSLQNKIYPSELGIEIEKLPPWVLSWIVGEDNLKKLDFISQLGVHTIQSTIGQLRNYFINKTTFDLNDIAKDSILSNGKLLINTLLFIKEKSIEISGDKQYLVLKEIVRVINSNGSSDNKITTQDNYCVEEIISNSKSSDMKTKEYQIFLYKGKLPKIVTFSEIVDYVYYRYNDGDYLVNNFDIYINEDCDHKTTLEKVVSDETNGFTFEDLWKIYNENEPEIDNPFKDIS